MIQSPIQQYIDLYNAHADLVRAGAPAVLNDARPAALATLTAAGVAKGKDFTATDPEAMLAPDYALNIGRYEVPLQRDKLFICSVPNLSTELHYLVNEQYAFGPERVSDDIFAGSLREFATRYAEVAARHYNRLAATTDGTQCPQGPAALNTLLAQDGFVLYVPAGVKHQRPVQLISLLRGVEDFMACQRLLIIVEREAAATLLLCDHANDTPSGTNPAAAARLMNLQTLEVYVDEGASLDLYELEEGTPHVSRLSQLYVHQAARSRASIGLFSLTAGATRCRTHVVLDGEEANINLFGMVIADRQQQVDHLTFIEHRHPRCTSNELFKYVLDEEAQGGFVGRILVNEGAVGTDAHQTVRNLCLTDRARMMARPELEIYADDVKCSHGATVGQLDADALYYMRTRGIPEAEARLLLMFAFMGDVIDLVTLEPLRDRLRQLVEKRFRGELSRCNSCSLHNA
jgi:Fe-S cluster assembly protein SufD